MVMTLSSCGNSIEDKNYKLEIYDYFNQVIEMPSSQYYKANDVVEITLKNIYSHKNGGIINNELDLEYVRNDDKGKIYSFVMPNKDSILKITYDGYFYESCGLGHHEFDNGRYCGNYSNVLTYTCQNCGYRTTDQKEVTNAYKFDILIENNELNKEYSYINNDIFNLVYGYEYNLKICFPIDQYYDDLIEDIDITCSSNLLIGSKYSYNSLKCAKYYFYIKDIGEAFIDINIKFLSESYHLDLNISDFVFEDSAYIIPSSEDEALDCKEFEDMVNNILYYQFDENTYVGFDKKGNIINEEIYDYDQQGNMIYSLDYLKYLPDSAYYPSHFDLILQNPLSTRKFSIVVENGEEYLKEYGQKAFEYYNIIYGVIDPGCTNPTYPIKYMSYYCVDKNSDSSINSIKDVSLPLLYSGAISLYKNHKEYFYNYKNASGLEVSIIKKLSQHIAVFEDQNYMYIINV